MKKIPIKKIYLFPVIGAVIVIAAVSMVLKKPPEEEPPAPPRLVQTVTVSPSTADNSAVLTGEVRAENEAGIGFQVDGKMVDRLVSLGDVIRPGQVVALLDPQDMENNLVAAKADLAAAHAELTEAASNEQRQRTLYNQGVAPKMRFEEAQRTLGVTRARVAAAEAHVKLAQDQLEYTKLRADVTGAVTETLAEAGEVVQAGQVIMRVAQDGGRDAVFDVPEGLMQTGAGRNDLKIDVALSNDPNVRVKGYIREISPQADPVTRTFTVKVGLINPPPNVRLGSVVTGRAAFPSETAHIHIPSMALNRSTGEPAVWIVDPASGKVSLRNVIVREYGQNTVSVIEGLKDGEVVVTAGVQSLHPGQTVRTDQIDPAAIEPAAGDSR